MQFPGNFKSIGFAKLTLVTLAGLSTFQNQSFAADLGLEEYKASKEINLGPSHSRLFKIGSYVSRTLVGDPSIAEPVVLCENQFVLVGKKTGKTTIVVWNDDNQVSVMKVQVVNQEKASPTVVAQNSNTKGKLSSLVELTLVECPLTEKLRKDTQQFLSPVLAGRKVVRSAANKNADLDAGYLLVIKNTPSNEVNIKIGTKEQFEEALRKQRKATRTVDLLSSQTRTFRTKNKISQVVVVKGEFVEPIVVSSHEFVLLGKAAGQSSITLQDDQGAEETITLNCKTQSESAKDTSVTPHLDSQPKPIPFVLDKPMNLEEKFVPQPMTISLSRPRCFNTNNGIVRAAISDAGIAEVYFSQDKQFVVAGRKAGETTAFIWDDRGNVLGFDVRISPDSAEPFKFGGSVETMSPQLKTYVADTQEPAEDFQEIEYWTSSSKDVYKVPRKK